MNNDEFNVVVRDQMRRCESMLLRKAGEYASDEDRLHNFKQAAQLQGVTIPQALAGHMSKHTVSIFDMVRSGKNFTEAQWDEKITDHLNYLFLLRAAVEENFKPREGSNP